MKPPKFFIRRLSATVLCMLCLVFACWVNDWGFSLTVATTYVAGGVSAFSALVIDP